MVASACSSVGSTPGYRISDTIQSYDDESLVVTNLVNQTLSVPSTKTTSLPIQVLIKQPVVTMPVPPVQENIMSQILPDNTKSASSLDQPAESAAPVVSIVDRQFRSDFSGIHQEIEKNSRAIIED